MTAKELKKKLIEGYRLKDLFHFSDGQDCIIYKSDFEITDDIIYRNKITPEERRRIKVLMKQNKGNVEIAKEIGRTYYATVHITSNIYK